MVVLYCDVSMSYRIPRGTLVENIKKTQKSTHPIEGALSQDFQFLVFYTLNTSTLASNPRGKAFLTVDSNFP
jgi:hypothetical protein